MTELFRRVKMNKTRLD